jgi:hypothetical protein
MPNQCVDDRPETKVSERCILSICCECSQTTVLRVVRHTRDNIVAKIRSQENNWEIERRDVVVLLA